MDIFGSLINQLIPSNAEQEEPPSKTRRTTKSQLVGVYRRAMKGKGRMTMADISKETNRCKGAVSDALNGCLKSLGLVKEHDVSTGKVKRYEYEWIELEEGTDRGT